MKITTRGIDLAKNVFQVHGANEQGKTSLKKQISRGTTLNRPIDDMATEMLGEFDAQTRCKLRAARGTGKEARGLAPLDMEQGGT